MFNHIEVLASAILNDLKSGLSGFHANLSISIELLCLDIVDTRLALIRNLLTSGSLSLESLYMSINCIEVDCKNITSCMCSDRTGNNPHFEIPLIITELGDSAIRYIGSVDKLNSFIAYTNIDAYKMHKYRKRGKEKPYVWIDTTPNENGMFDGWIFNAPLLNKLSVSAVFKDLRLLQNYDCCMNDDNMNYLDTAIKDAVIKSKMSAYPKALIMTNNQLYV